MVMWHAGRTSCQCRETKESIEWNESQSAGETSCLLMRHARFHSYQSFPSRDDLRERLGQQPQVPLVFASPFSRTLQTAQLIAEKLGQDVTVQVQAVGGSKNMPRQ